MVSSSSRARQVSTMKTRNNFYENKNETTIDLTAESPTLCNNIEESSPSNALVNEVEHLI